MQSADASACPDHVNRPRPENGQTGLAETKLTEIWRAYRFPRRGGSVPPGRGAPGLRGLRAPGFAAPGGVKRLELSRASVALANGLPAGFPAGFFPGLPEDFLAGFPESGLGRVQGLSDLVLPRAAGAGLDLSGADVGLGRAASALPGRLPASSGLGVGAGL